MEIYTLEISLRHCRYDQPWLRVIEVKEDFTIYQLHNYIQDVIAFDSDHLYEFYIGKKPRNISSYVSDDTKLNEIYPITGYKLFYLFDFGDSWLFQIKKSRKRLTEDSQVKYPRVVKSIGVNPEQYPNYG